MGAGAGWNVVGTSPAPSSGDGWNVVSAMPKTLGVSPTRPAGLPAGVDLPGFPTTQPIPMKTPQGVGSTIMSHLANMVSGPYHAFTDAPQNAQEQQIKGTDVNSGMVSKALGQFGLGAARILVQPTRNAISDSIKLRQAGGPQASLTAPSTYDSAGNNIPTAGSKLVDAIPVIGPWARSYANEVANNGILPATAGLATDALAPSALSKGAGMLRSMAPSLAEGALKISAADRGYGKTIGRAVLDETSGVRPSTILASTKAKLAQLNPQIDAMAAAHTAPVSIQPAIDSVGDAQASAAARNNVGGFNAIEPVKNQLTENYFGNNQPFAAPTVGNPNEFLAPMQTATDALGLKRGLRDQFVKNFSLDSASNAAKDAAKSASGKIDTSLDSSLGPDFSSLNQRISSLIPVEDAAEKINRSAEIPQALGSKLGKHTGALTGAAAGGAMFGPLGAAAGFALPEMLSSPTAQMTLARTLNSTLPSAVAPALFSGGVMTPPKVKK